MGLCVLSMLGLKRGDRMNVFIEIKGLLEFEQAEEWESAINLLYTHWDNDKGNVNVLCRLISECWYVLTEWDCCIHNENLSYDFFKNTLINATEYGLTHFSTDAKFLWITGYMISLFPYLFYKGETDDFYSNWEQKGKEMLSLSNQIVPDNPVSKVLYLGTLNVTEEYLAEKLQLAPLITNIFKGHTAIEEYFKDVLS